MKHVVKLCSLNIFDHPYDEGTGGLFDSPGGSPSARFAGPWDGPPAEGKPCALRAVASRIRSLTLA